MSNSMKCSITITRIGELETVLDEIEEIKEREDMPEAENNKVCRKCAYYEFCWA